MRFPPTMDWADIQQARKRLGREQGTIIKDWGGKIPIALIYPNTYFVGMSNLGMQALYALFNRYSNILCERVFWEKGEPLALESQRPLADFAVLAFSLTYELDYFNVVQILRASGIPLYARERDEGHPLVIAGGPCVTTNPAPLSPFLDALCIGEGEAIVPGLASLLSEGMGERSALLQALAKLPGIYVPQYPPERPVRRQWVRNLDDFPVSSVVLTPDTELGGLFLIEVERGCRWACRFCMVTNCFRPARFRSLGRLTAAAEQGLKYRKRLGLMGPAVTDHPQMEELVGRLREMGAEISVSSLRVRPFSVKVVEELARSGTRTVTLAPEAGSHHLRQVIRKGISEEDILEAIGKVAESGFKQVKLYFMFGLPQETDEDMEALIKLVLKAKEILDKRGKGGRLQVNAAPFVPKPGTPFQWLPLAPLPVLHRRLALLKKVLPGKGVELKGESPAWSEVQAVLARGDDRVARVLASVEEVSLAGWRKAATECRLDMDYYAHQRWDTGVALPWSVVDLGTEPAELEQELQRALGEGIDA
ncbi:MAG: radical SAM protein [Chloroflexota bacterium]